MKDFGIIDYIGGHPLLPKSRPVVVKFDELEKKFIIQILSGFKFQTVLSLSKEDIIEVTFEKSGERSIGKAATGAIVGGLLTGGLGLIAGAAIGATKKDKSELYISVIYNDRDFTIILKTKKKTMEIYNSLISLFV